MRSVEWLAIAAALAFLMVLPFGHAVALRSLSLLIALIATTVLWLASPPRAVALLPVFAVWLCAALLSLLTSSDLRNSLHDIDGEIVRSFIVFFVFFTLSRRYVTYGTWAVATAAAAAGVSLVAIAAFLFYGEWMIDRVPTVGAFATSAITFLPIVAGYLAFANRRATRAFAAVAIALTLVASYLTFSRSVWLVVLCGAAIAVPLYSVHYGWPKKRTFAVLVTTAAVALALAAAASSERDRDLLYSSDRVSIYSAVAEKIPHNPWTGTGYGHETDRKWYAAALPGTSVFHAHNIVLSFLDQMGIFGLLALALIFGVPARLFLRRLRSTSDEAVPAALTGLVLLVCVFVKNSFDYFFVNQSLWLFFAYLGIFLGELQRIDEGRPLAGPLRPN